MINDHAKIFADKQRPDVVLNLYASSNIFRIMAHLADSVKPTMSSGLHTWMGVDCMNHLVLDKIIT